MSGLAVQEAPAKPLVWLFSGQGAQYFGMARELYAGEPTFRRTLDAASDILAPRLGLRLAEEIYRDRPDRHAPFARTRHSNPAILAVQVGVARLLRERGQVPDLLLGYSLGELAAAVVGGALTLEEGLELSVAVAEVFERRVPPGAMLAVLGDVDLAERQPEWFAGTWIAGRNFPGHFVVAGAETAVERLQARLTAAEVVAQRLPVEFAFHSPTIEPAKPELRALLDALPRREASVELLSASSGRRARALDPAALWRTFREPVDFETTLARLHGAGPFRFVDLGPSGTLATFAKYGLPAGSASEIAMTVTPFGTARQNIERLLGAR